MVPSRAPQHGTLGDSESLKVAEMSLGVHLCEGWADEQLARVMPGRASAAAVLFFVWHVQPLAKCSEMPKLMQLALILALEARRHCQELSSTPLFCKQLSGLVALRTGAKVNHADH